ncbi:MAG: prepilin peptidase [Candidatus Nealsonbacteria bacterium]
MITFFFYFTIFAFGLIIGSFLNCLIYRLNSGGSCLKGRSFCPRCKHQLSWPDLVPVLSFILLRRKCRYCQKLISWQYPLIEVAAGLLFILVFLLTPGDFLFISLRLAIVFFLIVIFVYDLRYYLIPDVIVYPAILLVGTWAVFFADKPLYYIYSAIGASFFFFFIVFISKGRWMGVGDVKLAFLMGLILSWPGILVALIIAFFSGALVGLGLVLSLKKKFKSEVPFGPFLALGTLISMFWGGDIINWYLSLFWL